MGLWTAENPVAMTLLKRILVRLHADLMPHIKGIIYYLSFSIKFKFQLV